MRQPPARFPLGRELPAGREYDFAWQQCRAKLFVEFGDGGVFGVNFLVDSGASVSVISLDLLAGLGVDFRPAGPVVEYERMTAAGPRRTPVHPHRMKVWWSDAFDGHPFDWPVLVEPGRGLDIPPLLGLGGVIHTCRWTFDGRFTPDFPYGHLLLEDTR